MDKTLSLMVVMLLSSRLVLADFSAESAANWHQWRGPLATGIAPKGNPPIQWSESQNVQWKVEIQGQGSTTPIVWGDKVFVLTCLNTEKPAEGAEKLPEIPKNSFGIKRPRTTYCFSVLCFHRKDGRKLWEKVAYEGLPDEGHHLDNNFASSSPTTDGERLYAWFGSKGVFCFDLDGNVLWQYSLPPVQTRNSFGEACSPVVHGKYLVLNRDNEGKSAIEVLDSQTGKSLWKKGRDEVSAWATPLIVEFGKSTQLITNASKRVRSYDLNSGDLIWECGGQVGNVIPSPMRFQDTVLCLSGYRGSAAMAIKLDSSGDVTESKKVSWAYKKDTPYVPSALLYDNLLYFNKTNISLLSCLDAKSGEVVFKEKRLPDMQNMYASPVGAANRIYFVSREGNGVTIKHNSPMIEVLAKSKLDDGFDSSPAIVGNQMFLRGRKNLYCLEQR